MLGEARESSAAAVERLRQVVNGPLGNTLRAALRDYDRVAVLIDNLDKSWERGADFKAQAHFVLSLLVAEGKLRQSFGRSRPSLPPVNLTLAIFLRTDILEHVLAAAREPDKINPQAIRWDDEELLIRVLEERYAALRPGKGLDPELMWTELFTSEVLGLPTRDYLIWRVLPRPRDIIFLGNEALTTAVNRRHAQVTADDFKFAERAYSRFAVDALVVESDSQEFSLEEVLFEFAGMSCTISEDELREAVGTDLDFEVVRDWLIRTSFLGLEKSRGDFVYVQGVDEARVRLRASTRLAQKTGHPLRFRIHPAFRPDLDVLDDDLH